MRRLDASDWLGKSEPGQGEAAPKYGDQANTFNLTVNVQAPAIDEESGEG